MYVFNPMQDSNGFGYGHGHGNRRSDDGHYSLPFEDQNCSVFLPFIGYVKAADVTWMGVLVDVRSRCVLLYE